MRERQPLPCDWTQICLPDQSPWVMETSEGERVGPGSSARSSYLAECIILYALEPELHGLEMLALFRLVTGGFWGAGTAQGCWMLGMFIE